MTLPVSASRVAPSERGKNSYQLPNSARDRSAYAGKGPSTVTQLAQRVARQDVVELGVLQRGEPGLDRALGVARRPRPRPRAPRDRSPDASCRQRRPAPARSSSRPSVNISSTSTPAGILSPAACCQVRDRVGPGVHLEASRRPRASGVTQAPRSGRATSPSLGHPHGRAAPRRPGRSAPPRRRACRGPRGTRSRPTGNGLAHGRLGGLPTEVDQGRDVHDGDASDHASNPCELHGATQARADPPGAPQAGRSVTISHRRLERSREWRYRRPVRAIRRFTVRPVLPEPLSALGDLAGNLRWSWHPPTQDVFAAVDPELWEAAGPRPGAAARRRATPSGSRS